MMLHAHILVGSRDIDGATAILRKAMETDPESTDVRMGLSHMLILQGQSRGQSLDEAELLLRQTLVLLDEAKSDRYAIDKSMVLNNLANLLQWYRQDMDGAETIAREALALNPADANILHTMGLLLEKRWLPYRLTSLVRIGHPMRHRQFVPLLVGGILLRHFLETGVRVPRRCNALLGPWLELAWHGPLVLS